MRQYAFSQTIAPYILVLGVPIAGLVATFGLATSFLRKHRSNSWVQLVTYFAILLSAFCLGGSIGLANMRSEHFAYFNEADCVIQTGPEELDRIINATVFIDVLKESIGDTTTVRTLLVSSAPWSEASVPLKDADGNVKEWLSASTLCADDEAEDRLQIYSAPHIFVIDGFQRLIEIREIKTTE